MCQIIILSLMILSTALVGHCSSEAFVSYYSQSPNESRKLGKQGNSVELKETRFEPTKVEKEEESFRHSSEEVTLDHGRNRTPSDSKKHHRSIDKSIAGGGVVVGVLGVMFLVAVFCYIRATRRVKSHSISLIPNSPTTNSSLTSSPINSSSVTSSPTNV